MSLELNRISVGPGALNSEAQNEILEMLQLLKQWELEIMQQGVSVQAKAAQSEGDAAYQAQKKMAMSTQASAIGDAVGSGVGGGAEAAGAFGGPHGATIKENTSIAENAGNAETVLRGAKGQGGLVNKEATPAERLQVLEQYADGKNISHDEAAAHKTALLNKLKNGTREDFKKPLTADEKTLLGTFTAEEKGPALSNLAEIRKDANAEVKKAQEERSVKMSNFRTLGTVITGVTKGTSQGAASAYQMQQADFEKDKVVFQFVTTAQNNLQQQFSTLFDSYDQKQNKIIEADDSHFRRFGG